MLVLLSPAKSLDVTSRLPTPKHSEPRMLDEASFLVDELRRLSVSDVAKLMGISEDLATLNAQRFVDFSVPFTRRNARPAVLTFAGDVYQGLAAAERFSARDFTEAQKTVRILSGLYGVLRPLDLIQPYRLEMGTRFATYRGASLYEWWDSRISDLLGHDLSHSPGSKVIFNLASDEYSKAARLQTLGARVISPRFEDTSTQGRRSVVSFYAKRARGEMAAWLVLNRVRTASAIRDFDITGYKYDANASTPDRPVFVRAYQDRPLLGNTTRE